MSLNCSTCSLRDDYCKGLVYYCKKECIRHGLLKSEINKMK